MKFDLLYELQMPKPHDVRSEYRCVHEALEQIELADRLGFDTVSAVEHHFLQEFAHCSARRSSSPRRRSRRNASGSATVSCCCRTGSTIRSAWPSGSRCS